MKFKKELINIDFNFIKRLLIPFFILYSLFSNESKAEDLSNILSIIKNAPENSWIKMNVNKFSDAWVAKPLRPNQSSFSNPATIISAWSSFAWDRNRGDLIIFGGGHANYAGNEVYRWRGTTQEWELASLPSALDSQNIPKGGAEYAPQSSHTYDNSVFLPIADRFVTFGGAAFQSGGNFVSRKLDGTFRRTGPYFFDPNKADPKKVGGASGTGVNPSSPGGYMWENRDIYSKPGFVTGAPGSVNGTTDYAFQDGKEVIYISGPDGGGSEHRLARLSIPNYFDPSQDTWEFLGINWFGSGTQGAGAYDPDKNIYIKTYYNNNGVSFTFWNLDNPGPYNTNKLVTLASSPSNFIMNGYYGFDYDRIRNRYLLWSGGDKVFQLNVGNKDGSNWVVSELSIDVNSQKPADFIQNGVLGKWHYASNLDVFVGLENPIEGNVWFFKPSGWVNLSNDADGDSIPDAIDNCINVVNFTQKDTDRDLVGNSCDPDFNQNSIVDPADFSSIKINLGKVSEQHDLNGNGIVDPADFSILKTYLGKSPGPSGILNR